MKTPSRNQQASNSKLDALQGKAIKNPQLLKGGSNNTDVDLVDLDD